MKGLSKGEVENQLRNEKLGEERIKELISQKYFAGNKPTNSFLFKKLDAKTLGSLIAIYEHKIFVQGIIWQINSFDQFGVELGKVLAQKILPELQDKNQQIDTHNSSTNGVINYWKSLL